MERTTELWRGCADRGRYRRTSAYVVDCLFDLFTCCNTLQRYSQQLIAFAGQLFGLIAGMYIETLDKSPE